MNTDRFHFAGLIRVAAALIPFVCAGQVPQYTISTVAGTAGTSGYSADGTSAATATLGAPWGIALDSSGALYISEQSNHRIRKVGSGGTLSTVVGNGTAGFAGDGKSATDSGTEISGPQGLVVDSSGNIYLADTVNCAIRKVASGNISTIAGIGGTCAFAGENVGGGIAKFKYPATVALDSAGNLYIADTRNNLIRKFDTKSNVSTVAGFNEIADYTGDGVQATTTSLNNPEGVAVDAQGNVYIADTNNHRIRKVSPTGIISTIAGTGVGAFSGDGGPANKAALWYPTSVVVDAAGDVFIADTLNNRIRVVTPDGNINTVAGTRSAGYSGDGGRATSALLHGPTAMTLASNGNIYFTDGQNFVIRLLTVLPNLPAIKAGGVISASQFGAFPSVAPGSWIEIYGLYLASASRGWTKDDFTGNNAPTSLGGTTVHIDGQLAFIDYISPGQVNAQVPSNVGVGPKQMTVTTANGTSPAYNININSTLPGLLAPTAFTAGGKQYVAATFSDGAFVGPTGAFAGATTRPAKPGETIVLYGIGFGAVDTATPAGQIAPYSTLTSVVQFFFGDTQAALPLPYSGLAPGFVGLYQFNVVVPDVAAGDALPLTFRLGGVPATSQTLYIAVGK